MLLPIQRRSDPAVAQVRLSRTSGCRGEAAACFEAIEPSDCLVTNSHKTEKRVLSNAFCVFLERFHLIEVDQASYVIGLKVSTLATKKVHKNFAKPA